MKRLHKSLSQQGFTIVETMIVLALAGLILLIVFEAIPTLERSGRNDQRKQDVTIMLQAVLHYELSNSGDFPPALPTCGPAPETACSQVIPSSSNFLQTNFKDLTYYSNDNAVITIDGVGAPRDSAPAKVTNVDQVAIYDYARCDPNNPGLAVTAGADYSSVVAMYALEAGSTPEPQCQQL